MCVCDICVYIHMQITVYLYIVNWEVDKENHVGNWKVYNDLVVCWSVVQSFPRKRKGLFHGNFCMHLKQ